MWQIVRYASSIRAMDDGGPEQALKIVKTDEGLHYMKEIDALPRHISRYARGSGAEYGCLN